ncbi:MAG: hypothetical protein HRU14_07245 [Planctomycetes bacterium]|nr:hypothetical protein [Planctomycetota bacterium]
MSAPRPILELMDLQEDVALRRATLRAGPVRVEAPVTLLRTPITPPLDSLLDRAWFLAPTSAEPVDAETLASLGALAEARELYLDLALPGPIDPGAITAELGARIARLRIPLDDDMPDTAVHGSVDVARRISGRVVLDVTISVAGVERVPLLIAAVARDEAPRDVYLVPTDSAASEALAATWGRIAKAATDHGVTVSARRGPRVDAGPPLDPLAGANVLAACVRALFRSRTSVCPFPFVTSVFTGSGVAVCPAPDGPSSDAIPDDVWNAPLFTAVRQGFLDGDPPEPCRRCTLLPRVRRSLSETPWETGDGPADLPIGSIEV